MYIMQESLNLGEIVIVSRWFRMLLIQVVSHGQWNSFTLIPIEYCYYLVYQSFNTSRVIFTGTVVGVGS